MKRIITCSDGTWNKIGSDANTNVVKMYNSICKEGVDEKGVKVIQLKAYDEGVGTGYTLKDQLSGGLTGSGIDTNIKDMYGFIMLNYEPGDQIYLFGFSRGAYTARSIGGFIRNSGILKREYIHLLDKAYDLYRDKNDYSSPDSDLMIAFKQAYAVEEITPIYFIGVWDTVGSLGMPLPWYHFLNAKKYKFHDVKLSAYVGHAYHALAIDEKRKLFAPTLWEKSSTVLANPDHPQKLEQRWFAGSHSDVGGGYKDSALSDLPLKWLFDKAAAAGLCFNDGVNIIPDFDKGKVVNSYTPMYWFWLPYTRKPRNKPGEEVDESVLERFKKNPTYRPRGLSMLHNTSPILKNGLFRYPGEQTSIYTFKNIIDGVPGVITFYLVVYLIFFLVYVWKFFL